MRTYHAVWRSDKKLPRLFTFSAAGGSQTRFFSKIVFFVIALGAAYGVSQFILTGDWEGLGVVAVGAAGLVCAITILRDWRRGLYFFFGWLFVRTSPANTLATTWPSSLPRTS